MSPDATLGSEFLASLYVTQHTLLTSKELMPNLSTICSLYKVLTQSNYLLIKQ